MASRLGVGVGAGGSGALGSASSGDVECPEAWDVGTLHQLVYLGLSRVKLTSDHLTRIAQADDHYAQALTASLRFFQDKEPTTTPAQEFGGFSMLGKHAVCLAAAHSKLSEDITSLIVLPHESFHQDVEVKIRASLETTYKLAADIRSAQLKLDKSKSQWMKANKDLEELQDKPETSKKKMKMVQEVTACTTQYQQQIMEYNEFQIRCWNDYRKTVNDIKEIYQTCIKDIELQIKKLYEIQCKYAQQILSELESTQTALAISNSNELDQFTATNKAMQQLPQPVQFVNYQAQKKSKFLKFGHKKGKMEAFGVSIEDLLARQKEAYPSLKVPLILVLLRDTVLEIGGPLTEGIFRISGAALEVQQYRESFNDGDFRVPEDMCVHVVCSLFKLFLRELPAPLIPTELYVTFMQDDFVRQIAEDTAEHLVFEKLPPAHRDTFKFLLHFIAFLSQYEAVTKMTVDNLCLIFSQCLLQRPSGLDPMTGLRLCDVEKHFLAASIRALTQSNPPLKPNLPPPPPPNSTPAPPPTHTRDDTVAAWQKQQNSIWGSVEALKPVMGGTEEVYTGLGFPKAPANTFVKVHLKGKKKNSDDPDLSPREGTPKHSHSHRSSTDSKSVNTTPTKEAMPKLSSHRENLRGSFFTDDDIPTRLASTSGEQNFSSSKHLSMAVRKKPMKGSDLLSLFGGLKKSSSQDKGSLSASSDNIQLPPSQSSSKSTLSSTANVTSESAPTSIPPPPVPNTAPMSLAELQKIAALKSHSSPNLLKNIPPPASPPSIPASSTYTPAPPRLQIGTAATSSTHLPPPTPITGTAAASARMLLSLVSGSPPILPPVSPTLQSSSSPITPPPMPSPTTVITHPENAPHPLPKFPTVPATSPSLIPIRPPSLRSTTPPLSTANPDSAEANPQSSHSRPQQHHSRHHRHTYHTIHTTHIHKSESNLYSLISSTEGLPNSSATNIGPPPSPSLVSVSPSGETVYELVADSVRILFNQVGCTLLPPQKLACFAFIQANKSLLQTITDKIKADDYTAFCKSFQLLYLTVPKQTSTGEPIDLVWDTVQNDLNTLRTLIGYINFKLQYDTQSAIKHSHTLQVLNCGWLVPNQEASIGGKFQIVDLQNITSSATELSEKLKKALHALVQQASNFTTPSADEDPHKKNILKCLQYLNNTTKSWVSFLQEHKLQAPTLPYTPSEADPSKPACNISAAAFHTSFVFESELLPSVLAAFATGTTFSATPEDLERCTTLLMLLSLVKRTTYEATL
ncbi:DNA-dependent DNA helicase and ATPase [Pelomyxa schiedti]|nr:DNA-dependent DNA helicase and ATPase [Pelomyxa schiedti]